MRVGYEEHRCFWCHWGSRDDDNHYNRKKWPKPQKFVAGRFNIYHIPFVDPSKIHLLSMHIKLGMFENFLKSVDRTGTGFAPQELKVMVS